MLLSPGEESNPPSSHTTLLNKEVTQSYGQFRDLPGSGAGRDAKGKEEARAQHTLSGQNRVRP